MDFIVCFRFLDNAAAPNNLASTSWTNTSTGTLVSTGVIHGQVF